MPKEIGNVAYFNEQESKYFWDTANVELQMQKIERTVTVILNPLARLDEFIAWVNENTPGRVTVNRFELCIPSTRVTQYGAPYLPTVWKFSTFNFEDGAQASVFKLVFGEHVHDVWRNPEKYGISEVLAYTSKG